MIVLGYNLFAKKKKEKRQISWLKQKIKSLLSLKTFII